MAGYYDPPEKPRCEGEEPTLFDDQLFFGMALALCNECPVRWWCLNTVDPARNFYDGVVGGHAWHEGKPIPKWSDVYGDPVLSTYLGKPKLQPTKNRAAIVNHGKVDEFLVGKRGWRTLNFMERKQAAVIMIKRGTPKEQVAKWAHLDLRTINEIWKEEQ